MEKARNISKSMVSYLRKVREQKDFIIKETTEYERSKRHLANMMGIKDHEMTQSDVDHAIKYLFPSGLFDEKARPSLKHPDIIIKSMKDAQFNEDGRPKHYLFYTTKPNYYDALGKISDHLKELDEYEDEQIKAGIIQPPSGSLMNFVSRRWLTHEELAEKLIEKISVYHHMYFLNSTQKLLSHPYSSKARTLIEEFSQELAGASNSVQLPELQKDETGKTFAELITRRREIRVKTRVTFNGSGKIDIEGKDILFFKSSLDRQTIYFPLQLTKMQDQVDIFSRITMRPRLVGQSSLARAIRLGISRCLAAYMGVDMSERLRLAGLLTQDRRLKERKKYGQEGARSKFTWRKR